MIRGDPHKTIFVGRLSYKTDAKTLEQQFECFGRVKRVRLVKNTKTDKSKGYAFIEFEETRSAEIAYNRGDSRKIDGRRVLVDKELGRTDKYWLPRRLGGGKGGESRRNREDEAYIKEIKRELREQREQPKQEDAADDNTHGHHPSQLKRQKLDQS